VRPRKNPADKRRNKTNQPKTVKHLPERLSRKNRNRVLKLSTSYRNPMVKHVPELHNALW
jgi:hypothetical protein